MTDQTPVVNPQTASSLMGSTQPAQYARPTGMADNITAKDLRLPRIALLQSKSPQVENEEGTYKAGQIINTLTQEVFPLPIVFTPVYIFKNVIKWKPREQGGGMVYKTTNFTPDVMTDLQWVGTTKPTADQYINVVCLVQGYDIPLVISFCKTSLKTGQDLATLIQLSGCAWKYNYQLTSIKVVKKNTYYEFRIKRGDLATDAEGTDALNLFNQVKNISIDTDFEGVIGEEASTGDEPKEF